MSSLTTPKGPLPARVYWFRRLVLLSAVFLLVFTGARLLGGSSDASEGGARATTANADLPPVTSTTPGASPSSTPEGEAADGSDPASTAGTTKRERRKARKAEREAAEPATPTPPPLPAPTGPCVSADVSIAPTVGSLTGEGTLEIVLGLRTLATPACTWTVSPDTLTMKITSGPDDIWSSRECPSTIPTMDVVLYQAQETPVAVHWTPRRSDEDCSKHTEWAEPGYYHVATAALGGEPSSVQFQLRRPAPVTVTRSADPEKRKGKKSKKERRGERPGAEPSGAVEPNG